MCNGYHVRSPYDGYYVRVHVSAAARGPVSDAPLQVGGCEFLASELPIVFLCAKLKHSHLPVFC